MNEEMQQILNKLFLQAIDDRGNANSIPASTSLELAISAYKLGLRTAATEVYSLFQKQQEEEERRRERSAQTNPDGSAKTLD